MKLSLVNLYFFSKAIQDFFFHTRRSFKFNFGLIENNLAAVARGLLLTRQCKSLNYDDIIPDNINYLGICSSKAFL